MKLGIIDLGTNTFNLLIVSIEEEGKGNPVDRSKRLFSNRIPVMLGEGGINKGFITDNAINRALQALEDHLEKIEEIGCTHILAFGTSAIRSATNGKELLIKAESILGLKVKVIDGNEEAELIWLGARQALKIGEEPSLIMDIGGGSTEFILANDHGILWKQSFEIGAARMLERFPHHHPIYEEEVKNIREYFRESLLPLYEICRKTKPQTLIGCSGSFEALYSMVAYRFHHPEILNQKTEYTFDLHEYQEIYHTLLRSTVEQRLQMPGLSEMRVHMIVIATIFIDLILEDLQIHNMRCSTYSLKEGVMWKVLSGAIHPLPFNN